MTYHHSPLLNFNAANSKELRVQSLHKLQMEVKWQ